MGFDSTLLRKCLRHLHEALTFFKIVQEVKLKIDSGVPGTCLDLGKLPEAFCIFLPHRKYEPYSLKQAIWHEVPHIKNLLDGEPCFSFEPRPLLNFTIVDAQFMESVRRDIKNGAFEEHKRAAIAFFHLQKILSDKFVYDLLSQTPVKEDVARNEIDVMRAYSHVWSSSNKTVIDAWVCLEAMPLAHTILQYSSSSTEKLQRIVHQLEYGIIAFNSEIKEPYLNYAEELRSARLGKDRGKHYRKIITLINTVPLDYLKSGAISVLYD